MEEKKRWFNPDKPLWLPEGTVRALLVGGLTWALILILVRFSMFTQEIPESVANLLDKLLPALVLLIQGYINTRKDNGNGSGQ